MSDAPVMIFDSGMGGLSVARPIAQALPDAPLVYVADNAAFPYGTKREAEIAARVPALLGRLVERFAPRLVVIACNTASTIALDGVRGALDVPVVGTVPAIRPAAALSVSRIIGVLGTQATVRQRYVDWLSAEFAGDCTVVRHGSARLVDLAEAKLRGESVALADVAAEVAPLFATGAAPDVVVLACTHFPLLADELAAACPPGVRFVDGGEGIARRVVALTSGQEWPRSPLPGVAVFTRADAANEAYRPALAMRGFARLSAF